MYVQPMFNTVLLQATATASGGNYTAAMIASAITFKGNGATATHKIRSKCEHSTVQVEVGAAHAQNTEQCKWRWV